MKIIVHDPSQTTQRVRVGMIGLAAVLLLIGLAAAIFSTASKERPSSVAGVARPQTIANMTIDNGAGPAAAPSNEPLAELGVAPSAAVENSATGAPRAGSHPAPRR